MSRFVLKFLWLDKSIAVALDQRISDKLDPITEYFFWPRRDAWEEMRVDLATKPWVNPSEAVILLNHVTEVINYWQENNSSDEINLSKVREKFRDCIFIGRE